MNVDSARSRTDASVSTPPLVPRGAPPHILRGVTAVNGRRLEFAWITPAAARRNAPALVMLHDGLGCLAMWGDFPREVVRATGCPALVYSRAGHGQSDSPTDLRRPDYLHAEALGVLPALLSERRIDRPLLVGHREGGSIALIHAASGFDVSGIVAMAPQIRLEQRMLEGLLQAQRIYATSDWGKRLAKFHRDADATFRAWSTTWLAPQFRDWNIESLLPAIRTPIVLIQGEDDEYATLDPLVTIARSVRGPVESIELQGVGHAPWKDAPQAVIAAIQALVDRVAPTRSS